MYNTNNSDNLEITCVCIETIAKLASIKKILGTKISANLIIARQENAWYNEYKPLYALRLKTDFRVCLEHSDWWFQRFFGYSSDFF